MTMLETPTFTIKQFSYHKDTKTLVAEASDFQHKHFGQAYDDACDEGLTIRGKSFLVRYAVDDHDMNGDEIAGWRLKAIAQFKNGKWTTKLDEHIKQITVLIIND
jgi:phage-related protein